MVVRYEVGKYGLAIGVVSRDVVRHCGLLGTEKR